MSRQSNLHFEDEAMSVMKYRNPNVSNRISAHMPHSGHVTDIDASAAMFSFLLRRSALDRPLIAGLIVGGFMLGAPNGLGPKTEAPAPHCFPGASRAPALSEKSDLIKQLDRRLC
jgi:hypothetical protein